MGRQVQPELQGSLPPSTHLDHGALRRTLSTYMRGVERSVVGSSSDLHMPSKASITSTMAGWLLASIWALANLLTTPTTPHLLQYIS